jgi:4'-phosphopantetheinyl transferase
MLQIWILDTSKFETENSFDELLNKTPKIFHTRALRYINRTDSLSFLAGRLLLLHALIHNKKKTSLLEGMEYSEGGKPSIQGINFSISHSDRYVLLAFGTTSPLGIDIEKHANPNLDNFKFLFRDDEWSDILGSKNPFHKFYWYWVRKEALLKAVDCSLKELSQLYVYEEKGRYKDEQWRFCTLAIDPAFATVLAIKEKTDIHVEYLGIETLLSSPVF